MIYHYQDKISKIEPKCPPENYLPTEQESFRWVFDTIDDSRNFQAQAEKNPSVINDKTDIEKCSYYALSFFDSLESSKKRFQAFSYMGENAYKRLGTKVAKGTLTKEDGVSENVNNHGHFNFHPVKGHTLSKKFYIIDSL